MRWDVSFLPGGRGKGLDNKTRIMSLAADVWDVQDEMLSRRHKHRKHYHSTFQQERETLSVRENKQETKYYLSVTDSEFGLKLVV